MLENGINGYGLPRAHGAGAQMSSNFQFLLSPQSQTNQNMFFIVFLVSGWLNVFIFPVSKGVTGETLDVIIRWLVRLSCSNEKSASASMMIKLY